MRASFRPSAGVTIIIVCSILCGSNTFLTQNKCQGQISSVSASELGGRMRMNGQQVKAENFNYKRPTLIDTAELVYELTSPEWSDIGTYSPIQMMHRNPNGHEDGKEDGNEGHLNPKRNENSIETYADKILALLLIRFLAILQHQSDIDTHTLPTFPDMSTTTITRTILADVARKKRKRGKTVDSTTIPINEMNTDDLDHDHDLDWPMVLNDKVVYLLRSYIIQILQSYNDVFYHNYKHAYHVFLSANKLLDMMLCEHQWETIHINKVKGNKIKTTEGSNEHIDMGKENISCIEMEEENEKEEDSTVCIDTIQRIYSMEPIAKKTTRPTYGIKSDPYLQFSFLFSALVHDVDHKGVGNMKLSHDLDPLAILYNDQSITEQNSLTVAFTYLMKEEFTELRHVLFGNEKNKDELIRFRSNVIDLVLCTDVFSSERNLIVSSKYEQNFGRQTVPMEEKKGEEEEQNMENNPSSKDTNPDHPNATKAIVVLQQMLRIADVAANIQKWETFIKWGDNLSQELKACYMTGWGDDPIIGWYQSQFSFLNGHVLPLVRCLAGTKVLEEEEVKKMMHNIEENKNRWMIEGEHIVEKMKLK